MAGGAADHTEATTIALGLAYAAKARVLESRTDASDLPTNQRAIAVLQPLLSAPGASPAVRRAYVELAYRMGYEKLSAGRREDAISTEREVMRVAADLGARDLRDLDMGAYYSEAGGWMVTTLDWLGRYEEAKRVSADCLTPAIAVNRARPAEGGIPSHDHPPRLGREAPAASLEFDTRARFRRAATLGQRFRQNFRVAAVKYDVRAGDRTQRWAEARSTAGPERGTG